MQVEFLYVNARYTFLFLFQPFFHILEKTENVYGVILRDLGYWSSTPATTYMTCVLSYLILREVSEETAATIIQ